ncbi:MAG TPA: glutathione transferase GstA [Myxococcales bacterium]|nr:glutathione transferase GstA [Myxococcales bacterium]
MKLFYVPGVCSLSPHIVLREMGADFQLDKVDRKTKVSESGADYNQLNPKSYVPALQLDDGTVLTEGASILMYLIDQKGGEKLAPKAGTKERYKLQEWLVFIATELHKNYSPLFRKSPDPVPRETLQKRLDLVAGVLSKQPYLLGDKFSAADAYLFTILRWSPRAEVTLPQPLQQFMERVKARPAVAEALKIEGLT